MFKIGDEVQYVGENDGCLLSKSAVYVVIGFWPAGSEFAGGKFVDPTIAIGIENTDFREYVEARGLDTPHCDCWRAAVFRKIEKKRDRAELYTLLGISDMLNGTTRELTHV